jgi:hypothetical protein
MASSPLPCLATADAAALSAALGALEAAHGVVAGHAVRDKGHLKVGRAN